MATSRVVWTCERPETAWSSNYKSPMQRQIPEEFKQWEYYTNPQDVRTAYAKKIIKENPFYWLTGLGLVMVVATLSRGVLKMATASRRGEKDPSIYYMGVRLSAQSFTFAMAMSGEWYRRYLRRTEREQAELAQRFLSDEED